MKKQPISTTYVNASTGGVSLQDAIGQSEAFLTFQESLSKAARVDRPILLIGERGTGKELAAAKLHYLSKRWDNPFLTLNCAALSPTLIETELFGHEAGAFTGAEIRRTGRFEAAHRGTFFLDELGTIPLEVQSKILRVVEYGVFERVGNSEPIQVDVRLIGATNVDLVALARKGLFKEDLLDRLSFEVLWLPPLRARKEDILLLANHFAIRMAQELGLDELPEFSSRVEQQLESYAWPGNIRELKNVVERAVYKSESALIAHVEFSPFHSPFSELSPSSIDNNANDLSCELPCSLEASVRSLEIKLLRQALTKVRYNQHKAAEILGLTYHQFRGYYRKYEIDLVRENDEPNPAEVSGKENT